MNASQIHLALNHVPLFLSITGGLILLYGFIRKAPHLKLFSLYFLISAALFTIPVYLTGEGTEEMVEELPGISEGLIGKHEALARIGLIVIIITGVVALATLLIKKNLALLKVQLILCAFLSFISFGVMAQTAHLGGQIRHSEIRHSAIFSAENKNGPSGEDEKDQKREKEE